MSKIVFLYYKNPLANVNNYSEVSLSAEKGTFCVFSVCG